MPNLRRGEFWDPAGAIRVAQPVSQANLTRTACPGLQGESEVTRSVARHGNASCGQLPTRGCSKNLLILSCSARKVTSRGALPALELYDGVNFRVLRRFLTDHGWPSGLVVKIVSAKHGLIDATDIIDPYDLRMTRADALRLNSRTLQRLKQCVPALSVFVNLGSDYMPTIQSVDALFGRDRIEYAKGGIGRKMKAMRAWLHAVSTPTACLPRLPKDEKHYLYFFPDWDDYIYTPFVAEETDELRSSGQLRRTYAHEVFGKRTPYDGLLVSLAQLRTSKGVLGGLSDPDNPPANLRELLRLPDNLILFGDCGAFSYAHEAAPPFSPARAAELYERCGFDIGASVDHIPLVEIVERGENSGRSKRELSESTRRRRVRLTTENADEFLRICRARGYSFTPLGVIQGMGVRSYVNRVHDYVDMGYEHIALGGLVPRPDAEILRIVSEARRAIQERTTSSERNVWLHLFGILRPKLQASFRALGVSSFDSASYLRKAWLRSDQNYLAPDANRWYGSIRVPIAASHRMRAAAKARGILGEELATLERRCLRALASFDGTPRSRRAILDAVDRYGTLLERKAEDNHFLEKHTSLLKDVPWQACTCPICRAAGIDVVVFRGANRNKRRGLHNTWVLYHRILHGKPSQTNSSG